MKTPPLLSRMLLCLAICVIAMLSARADEAYRKEIRVTPLLKTQTDSAGQALAYPKTGTAEVLGVLTEIPAGTETGWHVHPSPCFAYILQGEVTVEREDGSKTTVKAGEAFAEVVNLKHNGRNTGSVPVKLVMFVVGTKDVPISVKTK